MCVHTAVSPGCERPMCLGVSDLMTPLTALIHTQVLVHIWKKTTCEEILPTEYRLCLSDCVCVCGGGGTFRLRVWPPLMLPLGQNRICLSFYLTDIIWHVFTSVTWKVTPFKNRVFFNLALLLSYLWSKLRPKMVNARKGVVWPESHKREGVLRGIGGWGETKTGQGRATHIFPLLCFYSSSLRLTGNALHCFHENVFSSMVNVEQNRNRTEYAVRRWLRMLPPVTFTRLFPLFIEKWKNMLILSHLHF